MASTSRLTLNLTPHFPHLPKYPSLSLPVPPKPTSLHRLSAQPSPDFDPDPDHLRVVFAAGGTGDHIYPAIAIADELQTLNPKTQTLFIGAPNSMESDAVNSAGFPFSAVNSAVKLHRPFFLNPRNLLLPFHLAKSLTQSLTLLKQFRPHVVVGTGGYVSFPTCLAAAIIGSRLVIQEQNSVPGVANWVLSFLADLVFVAFNSTVDCFPDKRKCVVCGNPVRRGAAPSKGEARLHFFPRSRRAAKPEARVVLVLGGSLGANAINIALLNLYYQMLLDDRDLFIVWQTGVRAYDEMESLVKSHPHLLLTPFLHSMDMAYSAADLIVSRAGAMTCYEILAAGKPCILIPSPNVAEGHQFKNASLMADLAGCKVITEDELDSTTLAIAIEEILGDENKMAEMRERALKAAKPDGSVEICQHILSLVNLSKHKEKQQ